MDKRMYKLAAIWIMDRAYWVEDETNKLIETKRIAQGYHLRIKDGDITDITDKEGEEATVLDMEGTINSSILKMNVVLNNGSVKLINIKGQ